MPGPSKSGLSSSTERELVWWIAKGIGPEEAAKRAGLPSSAKLYKYKRTKGFADDLRVALKDLLATEMAPKAIRILNEIMSDEKMPARVRVDAAKCLLDRSGFSAAAVAADPRAEEAELNRLTTTQLELLIADGMRRRLAASTAIDADFEVLAPTVEGEAPDGAAATATDAHFEASAPPDATSDLADLL